MEKQIINRPYYMEKIYPYINQPVIKILTGQRRVGKRIIPDVYFLLQVSVSI